MGPALLQGANVDELLKLGVEEGYFTEKDARQNFQFIEPLTLGPEGRRH